MNLRDIFVSVGCCAAAVCLGSGKPARGNDIQSGQGTVSRAKDSCAPAGETAGCDRIGGHVRVEFGSRMPNSPGHGQPGASPVAVRLGEGTQSRGHLRLPAGDPELDQYRR
jgi:hypothetical protein